MQKVRNKEIQMLHRMRALQILQDEEGYMAYDDDGQEMYNCVAWMPLPEPYKEGEA